MKKFSTLFLTAAMAVTLFSCSKDEETPSYKKADLLGTWELSSSTGGEDNLCSTQKDNITIAETTFTEKSYDADCNSRGTAEIDYTFDGKDKLSLMGGMAIYKILNLSANEVKFETSSPLSEEKGVVVYTK